MNSYSQGTDRNSFFELEFKSTPSQIDGTLELDLTISYGLKYYKFQSKKHKEIFGLRVHEMNLGFRDNKLEYIDVYYNKLSSDDFEALHSLLIQEYGDSETIDAIEKGVIDSYRWSSKDTTIDLYRYGNDVISAEDKNKTVLAISRPIK